MDRPLPPFQTNIIDDYEKRLEVLEYLLTILDTKLSRLKLALTHAPFPVSARSPILAQIQDTERLIKGTTEKLGAIRVSVSNLADDAP